MSKAEAPEQQQPLPPHVVQWKQTWHDFNRALRSPQPFHQWYWIRQLMTSAGTFLYAATGLESVISTYHLKQFLQSLIPAFGLGLVGLVWWSHLSSLRPLLRQGRCNQGETTCTLDQAHTVFVAYLIIMITWHYLVTCFSSPGVALPKESLRVTWKAHNAQGGFCCFNPPFHADAERNRVASYGTLDKSRVVQGRPPLPADNIAWEFPTTNPSYCEKCDIVRPPRCHHCKVCNRCILQVRLERCDDTYHSCHGTHTSISFTGRSSLSMGE